jgi:2-keto-3-deoxy-6-phosphogluconate aldolase
MLSPIFYNNKYSQNQILNPIKFNLISLNWKTNLCALGGINKTNIRKINLTKAMSIGVKSWMYKR